MNLELTFKEVCELLKEHGKKDTKLIDKIDQLLGLAMICSPALIGPEAAAVLPALAAKNELIKIGKSIIDKINKKKEDDDYLARLQNMQMAHALLCFTAFFEALDRQIPKGLRDKIALLDRDKVLLATKASCAAVGGSSPQNSNHCSSGDVTNPLLSTRIPFPHPTESFDQQLAYHTTLWKQMAEGFYEFIQKLPFWQETGEKDQEKILAAIKQLPEKSAEYFEAQYVELARKYNEFAIWANFEEHNKNKALIKKLLQEVKQYSGLSAETATAIDIGFAKLRDTILNIPETIKTSQATELLNSLEKHYQARVTDPIIEDKDESEDGKPKLAFPRVRDAFIPQSFRVLRQIGKARRLEDEATWKDLSRRDDLGAFIFNYLSSPFSTETPLLILGHPGSGKSLLTTVLSSRLMSKHFTAIRVPLREVNAEAGIVAQIEEAIRRITNIGVDSWAKLSSAFKNNPPLIILDGYDELLQASGKVFSGYLKEVQNFQKSEAEQGRPVRAIVTSRVTLIDKATVPAGATILRLLEFNKLQRERWVSIWNAANVNYFKEAAIKEFALPDEKDSGAEKILSLAGQPLLLLMLALYDSEGNQLRKSKTLDRTKLYDSLLRRFVTRERAKEKEFVNTRGKERTSALDKEMLRLGVAALGMYNRRKVHILSHELNGDLKFFESERQISVGSGTALSQADLLLGSFFFIHKSKAQHTGGIEEHHTESSAFEFLHNTFGEFLTADFILRRTLNEVFTLKGLAENPNLGEQYEQLLASADGFHRQWFASLVYTPLFTRPVVLEMMREWVGHILKERGLDRSSFIANLDTIVINQIKRLLGKREMPSIIRSEKAQEGFLAPFDAHPLLGHIAIYSANLVLLRVIVGGPFVFDEDKIGTYEDGTRPWDRLTHIWRSWFSLDNLNSAAAVLTANRNGSQITVSAKDNFQVINSQGRLRTILNVGLSLGDNITSGLAGLLLFEPSKQDSLNLDDIAARLRSERLDLEIELAMKRLFDLEQNPREDINNYVEAVRVAFELTFQNDQATQLEYIALIFRRMVLRFRHETPVSRGRSRVFEVLRQALSPQLAGDIAVRNAEAGLVLWRLSKEIGDREWGYRFGREFMEAAIHRRNPRELIDRFSDTAVAFVQLAREVGGERWFERFGPRALHLDFLAPMITPHFLMELTLRSPEAGVALVQLIREIGGSHRSERFAGRRLPSPDLDGLFDPHFLLELLDHSPEAALNLIQLGREIGGEHWIERLRRGGISAEFIGRMFDPRFIVDLSERNPDSVLDLLQLTHDIAGEDWAVRFGPNVIRPEHRRRIFDPRYLLDLSERSPVAALVMLQLATTTEGKFRFDERTADTKLLERMFGSSRMIGLLTRKPAAFAVVLRLVRMYEQRSIRDTLLATLSSLIRQIGLSDSRLDGLPLYTLPDLRWFTENCPTHQVADFIQDWLHRKGFNG